MTGPPTLLHFDGSIGPYLGGTFRLRGNFLASWATMGRAGGGMGSIGRLCLVRQALRMTLTPAINCVKDSSCQLQFNLSLKNENNLPFLCQPHR